MRLPIAECMESRIFTRAGAYVIKCGGLAVSAYERERERERERESSKIIVMAKFCASRMPLASVKLA